MTTGDDPSQRAEAIFEALKVSEAEERAKEEAVIEEKAQRLERIRERVERQD